MVPHIRCATSRNYSTQTDVALDGNGCFDGGNYGVMSSTRLSFTANEDFVSSPSQDIQTAMTLRVLAKRLVKEKFPLECGTATMVSFIKYVKGLARAGLI